MGAGVFHTAIRRPHFLRLNNLIMIPAETLRAFSVASMAARLRAPSKAAPMFVLRTLAMAPAVPRPWAVIVPEMRRRRFGGARRAFHFSRVLLCSVVPMESLGRRSGAASADPISSGWAGPPPTDDRPAVVAVAPAENGACVRGGGRNRCRSRGCGGMSGRAVSVFRTLTELDFPLPPGRLIYQTHLGLASFRFDRRSP
jgi:hypothetical protein